MHRKLRRPMPSSIRVSAISPAISPHTAIGIFAFAAWPMAEREQPNDGGMQRVVQVRHGLVCAVHGERVLDEVVGADRQEIELFQERAHREHGGGDLDHPAHRDGSIERHVLLAQALLGRAIIASVWSISLTDASIGTRICTLP